MVRRKKSRLPKKQYWKEYKRQWKKEERKTFTISLTLQEEKEVVQAVRYHKTNRTGFLKQAALAYIRQAYIVPDAEAVGNIRQLLLHTYIALQGMMEIKTNTDVFEHHVLQQIADLEHKILTRLTSPNTLEERIADAIKTQPEYRQRLLLLIEKL